MACSIRSKRIKELQARAKRTDIAWPPRKYAMLALTGVARLGEKTQSWVQRWINDARDFYQDSGLSYLDEINRDLDEIQARLDRQRYLLKKRQAREERNEEAAATPTPLPAPTPGEDVWDQ